MRPDARIIVIDDSIVAAKLTIRMLEEMGFKNIDSASGGNEAWGMLTDAVEAGKPYELILADWIMPDGSGLELLKKVRGDARFLSVFFCMITAESETQNIVDAVSEGINAYITKPLTLDSLQKKIRPFLEKRSS